MKSDLRSFVNDPAALRALDQNLNIDLAYGIDSRALASSEPTTESPEQVGLGSDPNGMWTPYPWLHLMFKDLNLKPGDLVCDVGAGIGRLGIYLREFRPDINYIGLELVPSRVAAAQAADVFVIEHDLEKHKLPRAEVYYYYNALNAPTYIKFIKQIIAKRDSGHEFLVVCAYDPYGMMRNILSPVLSIAIDYPLPHEFKVYSSMPIDIVR